MTLTIPEIRKLHADKATPVRKTEYAINIGWEPEHIDTLLREIDRLTYQRLTLDKFLELALEWRGIDDGFACAECSGSGIKTYANTATYHRSAIAGQAMTTDVCDHCWGSGSRSNPWPSRLSPLLPTKTAL